MNIELTDSNTIDEITVNRLKECGELLVQSIQSNLSRYSYSDKKNQKRILCIDLQDDMDMINHINSVLKYFGSDPVSLVRDFEDDEKIIERMSAKF